MIGFHSRSGRSLARRYYAYLGCFDSWRQVVDRVVYVDGGSDDGSVEAMLDWVGRDPRVEVLANEQSHWGEDFAWEQSALNMQLGQDALAGCDWIVRADADHLVDAAAVDDLEEMLNAKHSNDLIVSFDVAYFWNGEYRRRAKSRNWILNAALAQRRGIRVGWGRVAETGLLSDEPLAIEGEETFVDPETGVEKPILIGRHLPAGPVCDLPVYRYGHFFFGRDEALAKCATWDRAVADYLGRPRKPRLQLLVDADVVGIRGHLSRDEMLARWHPDAARRVIERYYEPGMLGGALYMNGLERVTAAAGVVARGQWALARLRHRRAARSAGAARLGA